MKFEYFLNKIYYSLFRINHFFFNELGVKMIRMSYRMLCLIHFMKKEYVLLN